MLSIIVATSKNNIIGKNNKLIWHIPEDLKNFKNITSGHNIIMGRKTFESLGRVLPNRHHVVLTHDETYKVDDENVEIIHEISDLEKYINSEEENFVIGGAMIYNLLINKCNKLYVTYIDKEFNGDAVFPKINDEKWKVTKKVKGLKNEDNPYDYYFIEYERNN